MTLLKETPRPFREKLKSNFVVGFNARDEVSTALKNFNTALIEGKTKNEAGERSFAEIAENLRSWDEEFNKEKSVFSANYSFGLHSGNIRILDQTKKPVADKIRSEERKGKALGSWLEAENFLLNSPDNSLAVIMSPQGESGLVVNGKGFDYVDSYVQIAGKINGEVVFFTIRTYAKIESARTLHSQLVDEFNTETKKPDIGKTSYSEVSNIVGAPIKLSSSENPILNYGLDTFVFNLLTRINNLEPNIFGKDEQLLCNKSLDSVYNEFLERQKRLKLDQKKQPLIDKLKTTYFGILNQLHIKEVQEFLSQKLEDILRKFTLLERGEVLDYKTVLTLTQIQRAGGFMKTMHGCSGAGDATNEDSIEFINSLGGIRAGISNGDKEDWHLGECGKCGAGKKDPKVEVSCGLCRSCVKHVKEMKRLGLSF